MGRSDHGARDEFTDVRLGLLGGFVASITKRQLMLPLRVQRLVAFLALRGHPLHRTYVAGHLWLEASQEQANGSLRATIWNARRLQCPLVQVSSTHVGLSPLVVVDVHELEQCAARVLHGDSPPLGEDIELLAHASDLLPDWYEDWVVQDREQLQELRVHALERAAERLIAAHRNSEASIAALAAVNAEPLRESSCYLLVRATLAAGNYAQAHRHFSTFRTRLSQEVGLEPSPRIRELISQPILRREFSGPSNPPSAVWSD